MDNNTYIIRYGLGLRIVWDLLRKLNGRMEIGSDGIVGSTFTIILPEN